MQTWRLGIFYYDIWLRKAIAPQSTAEQTLVKARLVCAPSHSALMKGSCQPQGVSVGYF